MCAADENIGEQQSDEALAFVTHYTVQAPSNSKKARHSLTMWYSVWETKSLQSGKPYSYQPSCGVVAADSIMQQVCICPHFALLNGGALKDFLLNDMLDLWPDLPRIPQGGAVSVEQQQPAQQQQLQPPLKRMRRRA